MQICSKQLQLGSFFQQQSLYESARCSRMNYSEKDFQVNSVKLLPHILYETKRCWACEDKKKPSKLSILGTFRKLSLPLQFKTYRWVGKYYELLICLQHAKSRSKDFKCYWSQRNVKESLWLECPGKRNLVFQEHQRIIELFRLDKTFRITKSNTALPSPALHHVPKCHMHIF